MEKISSSEITPENIYLSRRQFMRGVGVFGLGAVASAACTGLPVLKPSSERRSDEAVASVIGTDEMGDSWNEFDVITNYNNYYEFTTDKEGVASRSQSLRTKPWVVSVGGLVKKPAIYDIDDLIGRFDQEERVYRLRCVEGWSMVIPWFSFAQASRGC